MANNKNKKDINISNEVQRLHVEIDRYITNPDDREKLKKYFESNYLLMQFFFRQETDRDIEIEERTIRIVMKKMQEIYTADNKEMCKNVTDAVMTQLTKYLAPWNVRLQGIEKALERVASWQKSVDLLIEKIDKRVENLEDDKDTTDKRLQKLENYTSWKSLIVRKAAIIIITALLTLILSLQILNSKFSKFEQMLFQHINNTEQTK